MKHFSSAKILSNIQLVHDYFAINKNDAFCFIQNLLQQNNYKYIKTANNKALFRKGNRILGILLGHRVDYYTLEINVSEEINGLVRMSACHQSKTLFKTKNEKYFIEKEILSVSTILQNF